MSERMLPRTSICLRELAPGLMNRLSIHHTPIQRHTLASSHPQQWLRSLASQSSGGKRSTVVAQSVADVEQGEERIIETELRHEAEQSYLSYAMSVIVGRALPDVRDGLKPVHRRILYAMHELGLQPTKPFRKCARVVGEVLGKFHPHGDTAVYDALVRMSQDFSMRVPLVDGHGNFGSLDDDPPAAMRYTECRLQPLAAAALLADLDSDTVDFLPNFDASVMEPSVLPAKLPNLLINGSSGIAVGIATKIPPHNMSEVVRGLKALISNPDISVSELMKYIPAPDFPTGGEIIAGDGLKEAYTTGRGSITVRAKMHIEDSGKKKPAIVITELPYQTNKAALVEQVAKLVDEGKITGVSDVRDESDRSGMRVVIEIKRGGSAELTMNQLIKFTTVQTRFSCNMIGLVDGLPKTLSLKDFLSIFLEFRCQVVQRRAEHELAKASKRLHLVDGFLLAMQNLDGVVKIIREAVDAENALLELQTAFGLTKEQAEGVLGLTLRRLTSLEAQKLAEEQSSLRAKIEDIKDLLQRKERILEVVSNEADEIANKHGSDRRTQLITDGVSELHDMDIIPNAPSIVVYSRKGYIKRMSADTFAVQGKGGQGKTGTRLKEDDNLEEVVYVNDHDNLLFFTNEGHAYAIRAYDVPEASRTATGTAITQILKIARPNSIAAMLPVSQFADNDDVVMLTAQGQIKRTALSDFSKINARGILAMKIRDGDSVKFVDICSTTDSLLITSSRGMAKHFPVDLLRRQARTAMGVKTMDPGEGSLVGMSVLPTGVAPEEEEGTEECEPPVQHDAEEPVLPTDDSDGPCLFCMTKKGLAKRVPISSFSLSKGRVGKGTIAVRLNDNDALAAALVVGAQRSSDTAEDILISTMNGMVIRVPANQIAKASRYARGHRAVKLKDGDEVSVITRIQNQD